jgi:hypothetical protein
MEGQVWLRKGGAEYVRSKMKSEPRALGMRAGATVLNGEGQILRRVKRTLDVSSLSYLLARFPGGLSEARWGTNDTLGSLPNTVSRPGLTFALPLALSASKLFSLPLRVSLPPFL